MNTPHELIYYEFFPPLSFINLMNQDYVSMFVTLGKIHRLWCHMIWEKMKNRENYFVGKWISTMEFSKFLLLCEHMKQKSLQLITIKRFEKTIKFFFIEIFWDKQKKIARVKFNFVYANICVTSEWWWQRRVAATVLIELIFAG
jgi:hypothetical protein